MRDLCRNVEMKATLADIDKARAAAELLGAESHGVLRQRDTYFHVASGRLKLRETDGDRAELIWYDRPDHSGTRASHYYRVPVPDPDLLKDALRAAVGVRVVVNKCRELYLWRNVRIHLDQVDDLGTFLEFEAVLEPEQPEADGDALIADLRAQFGIEESALIACSYADLLAASD